MCLPNFKINSLLSLESRLIIIPGVLILLFSHIYVCPILQYKYKLIKKRAKFRLGVIPFKKFNSVCYGKKVTKFFAELFFEIKLSNYRENSPSSAAKAYLLKNTL